MSAHGQFPGGQLAQAVVDRIFARQVSLTGKERLVADQLAADLVKRNETLREAAFASLRAMTEVEGAKNNLPTERRILDTVEWLKQFGGLPAEMALSEALEQLRAAGVSESDASEEDSTSNGSDSADSASEDGEAADTVPPQMPPDKREGDTWQIA
jgi:hypothetical protein